MKKRKRGKTHRLNDRYPKLTLCGRSHYSNMATTTVWKRVDCKNCLRLRAYLNENQARGSRPTDAEVDLEIQEHGRLWCSKNCHEFIPEEYRKARKRGKTRGATQQDHDLHHVWR